MSETQAAKPLLVPMTKEEATEFFGVLFRGEHHIPSEVKPWGRGWKVSTHSGRLATFDFDDLTRLVFLAHDRCVRAEIIQSGPGRVGIAIWKRHGRSGDMYSRHPSIKCALVNWRMLHPAPADGADEHGAER
jgi:hypothetical protein